MPLPNLKPGRFLAVLLPSLLFMVSAQAQQRPTITAVKADKPPVLDGKDDDAIWQSIKPISDIREARPTEDVEPKQKTEFRVAYDAENLYVFVRAWDTHPDSIISPMSRRDDLQPSDYISVLIDPFRDRRTGHEFAITPSGVKSDYAMFDDGNEDSAWDGVWDVSWAVDKDGWSAEFRIPFSQLRFPPSPNVTFGFSIWRQVQRYTSVDTWPSWRPSKGGLNSQFGDLTGLIGLASPRRAELAPYIVAQNEPRALDKGFERHQKISAGADIKYAISSGLTLNATVNPDFGQVEADPSSLNLSAFETFFSERRPFFVAGSSLFDFRANCFAVNDCSSGEGMFYSRRIGRAPSLSNYGDATSPTSTRVLGAAKLTGRTSGGLSIGFLDAVTDRVVGTADRTMEPTTNYSVLRANQSFAAGNGNVGLMLTGVNRSLDQWTENSLRKSAYTGGVDARRRFGRFELSGRVMASDVAGTAEVIAATQRSPTHYYQRPDDDLAYDPTKTSLSGYATEFRFNKVSGQRTLFETSYGRNSEGFEINDLGFLRKAGEQSWNNWMQVRWNKPNKYYQRFNINMNYWSHWTLEGLPTDRAFNGNAHTQLNNRWNLNIGFTKSIGDQYCDRNCTRGGPALRSAPYMAPWVSINGDNRHPIVPYIYANYTKADEGKSIYVGYSPGVDIKFSDRVSTSIGVDVSHNKNDTQWFGNFDDNAGIRHYTFARLDQKTLGLSWRLNYIFNPNMSLQWYGNPFISKGTYSNVQELDKPRADHYDDRFKPYSDQSVAGNPGGFNVKEFRSNAVFRWEYRPGSALFLVWSQGREGFANEQGHNSMSGDIGDLFGQRADDRFLVKFSYWINR